MTVRELMELLTKMDPDISVVYPDRYERNEGWEEESDTATCEIDGAFINNDGDLELF